MINECVKRMQCFSQHAAERRSETSGPQQLGGVLADAKSRALAPSRHLPHVQLAFAYRNQSDDA
jgi:hypothetical protein